jgi:hypothetical protein
MKLLPSMLPSKSILRPGRLLIVLPIAANSGLSVSPFQRYLSQLKDHEGGRRQLVEKGSLSAQPESLRSPVLTVAKSLLEYLTREGAEADQRKSGTERDRCTAFYKETVDDVRALCKGLRSAHRQVATSMVVIDQRSVQRAQYDSTDSVSSPSSGRSNSVYKLFGGPGSQKFSVSQGSRRSTSGGASGARKKSTVRGTCRKSTVGSSAVRRLTGKYKQRNERHDSVLEKLAPPEHLRGDPTLKPSRWIGQALQRRHTELLTHISPLVAERGWAYSDDADEVRTVNSTPATALPQQHVSPRSAPLPSLLAVFSHALPCPPPYLLGSGRQGGYKRVAAGFQWRGFSSYAPPV